MVAPPKKSIQKLTNTHTHTCMHNPSKLSWNNAKIKDNQSHHAFLSCPCLMLPSSPERPGTTRRHASRRASICLHPVSPLARSTLQTGPDTNLYSLESFLYWYQYHKFLRYCLRCSIGIGEYASLCADEIPSPESFTTQARNITNTTVLCCDR